jgi:hypothetical protein
MRKVLALISGICIIAFFQCTVFSQSIILNSDNYRHYIDTFNVNDNELYKNFIPNEQCWEFLSGNIPLLDIPDKTIERTYYFRWWTYRKHIKLTPDGFVITEFLPKVPWSGKYNTICCPAALHFYEGRWLHERKFLNDYAIFWFRGGGSLRTYSFWPANAIYNYSLVSGSDSLCKELLPDLVSNYEAWEREKQDKNGLFWQIDGNDGMEVSVCGSGYRATINSYMYGEANAIADIAKGTGKEEVAARYHQKALVLKKLVQNKLWDSSDNFFKVLPRDPGSGLCDTRELHGYTPWYFCLPGSEFSVAWKYLMNPDYFYAIYGPTTTEQSSRGFKIMYEGHECQWNGPSWPYATSVTLTAMANLLNEYNQNEVTASDYYELLQNYAGSHHLKLENGRNVSWIDENLNPFTGDWISRTRLSKWNNGSWSDEKGGVERGKDYNHSTFCDLVITGLIGIRPQSGNGLIINPLLPENGWEYFCLDNILYHGKILTVFYDKTGKKYKKGKGFFVLIDGKVIVSSKTIKKVTLHL